MESAMSLSLLDWTVIIGFFILIVSVGISYTGKAGKNLESFFLGGRNLPWYIAGISMVATTFAADTPLAVTELVGQSGISGNWLWWSFLAGGMLTTFFFARLWRNSGVLTEVELSEMRYSGTPAAALRGFKSIYLGVFMNVVIIAWVNVALMTLLEVFFGLDQVMWLGIKASLWITAAAMLWTALYSSLSGLMGVAITDVIQFIMAMTGTIILAILVVNAPEVGGIEGMKSQLPEGSLNFFPSLDSGDGNLGKTLGLSVGAFLSYAAVQWWASWYPGAEPGGGGYIAQRMMSARSPKDAVYATLFFQIAHYCLRPWPWIIVGLCALILYPELSGADLKNGYVLAMKDYLPSGLKGLLLISFFAAYMSTISTQLNWGASYVVNDLYKRFMNQNGSQKHYVGASRITTVFLMILGLIVCTFVDSISGAWGFIMQAGAGLGLVLILRWYWWRINAWSEISAMIAPFIPTSIFFFMKASMGDAYTLDFPTEFLSTVAFTTVVWLVVTFITPATDRNTLQAFYNKVRPDGLWTGFSFTGNPTAPSVQEISVSGEGPLDEMTQTNDSPIEGGETTEAPPNNLLFLFLCWISAIVMTYGILFLIGKVILGEWTTASILSGIVLIAFLALRYCIGKTRVFA